MFASSKITPHQVIFRNIFGVPLSYEKKSMSRKQSYDAQFRRTRVREHPSARKKMYPPCALRGLYIKHFSDVVMGAMASQITSLTIVYSSVYSGADHRKHQSSASLAFVWGVHRWPVNSPHKWPVTWKMSPFDDVIMKCDPQTTLHSSTVWPTWEIFGNVSCMVCA